MVNIDQSIAEQRADGFNSGLIFLGFFVCLITIFFCANTNFNPIPDPPYIQHWRRTRPHSYQIEITFGRPECTWSTTVVGDTVAAASVSDPQCIDSFIGQDAATVDWLFMALKRWCLPDAYDCVVEFDPTYSYPKRITSPHVGIFVTHFSVCNELNRCEG